MPRRREASISEEEHTTHHERKHVNTTTRHHHEPVTTISRRSKLTSGVVVALLSFLYIGAVLQLFAQFFGVLGLTVSASPNARNANGDQQNTLLNNFDAADWVMDVALSRYATVAWTAALAAAVAAKGLLRTSSARKPH
jgi:hypothetical protein